MSKATKAAKATASTKAPAFLSSVVPPATVPKADRRGESSVPNPVATVWAYMEHARGKDGSLPAAAPAIKALVAYGVAYYTARTQTAAYRAWDVAGRGAEGRPRAFKPIS